MGTVTKMELQAIGNVHFALKLEYVQKLTKNIAAQKSVLDFLYYY